MNVSSVFNMNIIIHVVVTILIVALILVKFAGDMDIQMKSFRNSTIIYE